MQRLRLDRWTRLQKPRGANGRCHCRTAHAVKCAARILLLALLTALSASAAAAEPDGTWWAVDEIRPGMKGIGKTVMKGTDIVPFQAEVIGVMKKVGPGRDMVLARLSGANLEHSGVVSGMSGSPIYVDGKLLGAVAYAWSFGKEPIAGVTPFAQMRGMVSGEPQQLAQAAPHWDPDSLSIGPGGFELFPGLAIQRASAAPSLLTPLVVPLSATGLGPETLRMLTERLEPLGIVPLAGGSVPAKVAQEVASKPLEPGSLVSVALMTGDFELSGVGTVTHVEGDRVYAFGHPLMGLGRSQYVMRTGYVHAVYPRHSLSMKLGSGVQTVGTVDADVSTCIAGRLGAEPDLLPVTIRVARGTDENYRTYRVQLVRQPVLLGGLIATALGGALEGGGGLPDELTIEFESRVNAKGHEPLVLEDVFSGSPFRGSRGAAALFGRVATLAGTLVRNPFESVRLESIEARIRVVPERRTAKVGSVELNADRFEPGDTLVAGVDLRPFKETGRRVELKLPLPEDLPPGRYEALVCSASVQAERRLRDEPYLRDPKDLGQIFRFLRAPLEEKNTDLFLRVSRPETGVALEGVPLVSLPKSALSVFQSKRRTATPSVRTALVSTARTDWVLSGSHTIRFQVVRDKKTSN